MKLPHETPGGTLIAGIVLTVLLFLLVRMLVNGSA